MTRSFGRCTAPALRGGVLALGLVGAAGCNGPKQDLSTQQLSAVVAQRQPELEQCYHTALEKHPYRYEMRMEAVIHIQPSGDVSGVEIDSKHGLEGMVPCLRDAIAKWKFPKAKDPTDTSLPLIFRPELKQQADEAAIQKAMEEALGNTKAN